MRMWRGKNPTTVPNLRAPRRKKLRPEDGLVDSKGGRGWYSPVKIELKEYATNVVAMIEAGSPSPIWSAMLEAMIWKNG